MRTRCLVTAAAALALAGCATSPQPEDEVRAAAGTFLQNCAEGEGVEASESLTEPTRELFLEEVGVLAGCRRVLGIDQTAVQEPAQLRAAHVVGADEHGGIGSAELELPGGVHRRVEAEQVEGRWKLALPPLQP